MNKFKLKGKSVFITGSLCAVMLSGSALAERVDFTASTHINRGTCTLAVTGGGDGLLFDFGEVTPISAFAGTFAKDAEFKLNDCVAVNNINVSLSSANTTTIASGTYAGKWVVPASGGATGVAYKTEIRNGRTADYFTIQADGQVPTGTQNYVTDWYMGVKATLIPTVASIADMEAGSLASTAVINIAYL